jgi:hypothetical protein
MNKNQKLVCASRISKYGAQTKRHHAHTTMKRKFRFLYEVWRHHPDTLCEDSPATKVNESTAAGPKKPRSIPFVSRHKALHPSKFTVAHFDEFNQRQEVVVMVTAMDEHM